MGLNKKKIAVICNYQLLPERVGGMDYFFWGFDKKCRENDIEVDWFFPNKSNHGYYLDLKIHSSQEENVENNFIYFCKTNKPEYTHIITHFVELCTSFFFKVKKLSNAEIIVVDHNPRPLNRYPLKKRIKKRIKGLLFSRYINVFIGVSKYTVDEILNDFGSHLKLKTRVIYNGVIFDAILARDNRSSLNPKFLVASHLRESKGIQDLIDAVHLLPSEIKNEIRIDVYGDGPHKNNLKEKIKKFSLEDCFAFMGSRANLNEIFCHYDYLLQPTHMECFSLSILESLAANVPVITTNVGGNEEVITDGINGFIIHVKDVKALTSMLEDIYSGNKKIVINTRELITDSFSLSKMIDNHFIMLKN